MPLASGTHPLTCEGMKEHQGPGNGTCLETAFMENVWMLQPSNFYELLITCATQSIKTAMSMLASLEFLNICMCISCLCVNIHICIKVLQNSFVLSQYIAQLGEIRGYEIIP